MAIVKMKKIRVIAMADQKDALLKACLYALNEIPNRRLSGPYASTYALAEQVSKLLQRCK